MDCWRLFMLLFCVCFKWIAAQKEELRWTYTGLVGQSEWSEHFPDCGGPAQSPVDVVTSQTKYDPTLTPLTPLGYSQHNYQPFTLHNSGHTVMVTLPEWMGLEGMPWLFSAVQLHLHWGSGGPSHGGSEHTIDGLAGEAELHIVHYNSELFTNISAAMKQKNGLAVLGILIEAGDETNPGFNNIIRYLSRIRHAEQKVLIPGFDVSSLLPKDLGRYYRYNGSLTTPPCYQEVIWTVFYEKVKISKTQLFKLETILYSSKYEEMDRMLLQDNYRATQPLNHRVILKSFSSDPGKELSPGEVTAIVVGVICGCVGLAVIIRFITKTIHSTSSWDLLHSQRPAPPPRPNDVGKSSTCTDSTILTLGTHACVMFTERQDHSSRMPALWLFVPLLACLLLGQQACARNEAPCQLSKWNNGFQTFLKRHIREDTPRSLDQNQWEKYIQNNGGCHRPTQSFLSPDDLERVKAVCSARGGKVFKENLCISREPFSFVTVRSEPGTCSIRKITSESKHLILACEVLDNRCVPVHFEGNPSFHKPSNNDPDCGERRAGGRAAVCRDGMLWLGAVLLMLLY
uniref:carbonic anhydrase n=1 Tax=Knipowitschia caucasica TaxID=637954 RepID=A0AAV2MCQ9_KNICA